MKSPFHYNVEDLTLSLNTAKNLKLESPHTHLNLHMNPVCVFSILGSVEVIFLSLLIVFYKDLRTWSLGKSFHIQGKCLRACQKAAYTLEKEISIAALY